MIGAGPFARDGGFEIMNAAWHKKVEIGGTTIVDYYADPSPSEITVQAFQAIAAGGKGLLWFQVNQDRAKASPASWNAVVGANKLTRAVRTLLREGERSPTTSASSRCSRSPRTVRRTSLPRASPPARSP